MWYIINLDGVSDHQRNLVDHEAWVYITEGGDIPDKVLKFWESEESGMDKEELEELLDGGTLRWDDNDRALHVVWAYHRLPEGHNQANKFIKGLKVKVSDEEYYGVQY